MADYFEKQLHRSFFQAVRNNDQETMENYLNRFELDVNLTDELGNSALNLAAQLGLYEIVDRLIELGADQHKKNYAGQSSCDYAIGQFKVDKAKKENNQSFDEMVAGIDLSDGEGGDDESEFEIEDL